MADSGSIGFGFRLLHLSLFTFLYVSAAVLIAIPATRLAGSVFAGTIMAAAAGTVALNGEFSHAIPPLTVLALLGVNVWLTWSKGAAPGGERNSL